MNSLHNNNKLVSCPKCGNLFHNNCFDEYLKHKNKSNETPIINSTNVYNTNRFTFNPNLLQVRAVSEINNSRNMRRSCYASRDIIKDSLIKSHDFSWLRPYKKSINNDIKFFFKKRSIKNIKKDTLITKKLLK